MLDKNIATMPSSAGLSKFILERLDHDILALVDQTGEFKPFYPDFTDAKQLHRIQTTGLKDPLARAVGIKKNVKPHVIDATAGCGNDGFLLASLGCAVTLIEQSEIMHALLDDALARAKTHPRLHSIVDRIELIHGDACEIIPTSKKPDVIYVDPMFPESKSHAKVKKNMQILQHIVGHQSEEKLLNIALQHTPRVVLKRPRKLNQSAPKHAQVIETKTTQFWIFIAPSP